MRLTLRASIQVPVLLSGSKLHAPAIRPQLDLYM